MCFFCSSTRAILSLRKTPCHPCCAPAMREDQVYHSSFDIRRLVERESPGRGDKRCLMGGLSKRGGEGRRRRRQTHTDDQNFGFVDSSRERRRKFVSKASTYSIATAAISSQTPFRGLCCCRKIGNLGVWEIAEMLILLAPSLELLDRGC